VTSISGRLLALRLHLLWIRHSYTFRWAHRPLCDRFRPHILRVGPLHLCRSCLCAYAGLTCTAILCLFLPPLRQSCPTLLLCLMPPTIALSLPRFYKHWPRPLRDLLRFSMGACIPLCVCLAVINKPLLSVACAATLLAFWKIYLAIRRQKKAHACKGCPELGHKQICSGCQHQAHAIRAYESQVTRLLLAARHLPPIPHT